MRNTIKMNFGGLQEFWGLNRIDREKENKPFKAIFSKSIETGETLVDERQQLYSNHSSSK